jgi:DNA-3-methyladenine glycosylase
VRHTLDEGFFGRKPQTVAREVLGKFLVRKYRGKTRAYLITETEAYDGSHDLACHARAGKTARNAPMWGKPAHAYVYFTYGMHWMLNFVTREEGYPSAVLIRGAGEFIGPARLTKGLKIDRKLNAKELSKQNGLWVEDRGVKVGSKDIAQTPRIGISYAGEWAKKPWRFVLKTKAARVLTQHSRAA